MNKLNSSTRIFIGASILLAILIFLGSLHVSSSASSILPLWFFIILVCGIATDLFPIQCFDFGGVNTEVSVSLSITFAIACVFPPPQAIVLAVLEIAISYLILRKSFDKIIFNSALYAIVIGGTSILYSYFSTLLPGSLKNLNLLAIFLAAIYYVLSQSLILSALFSKISQKAFSKIFISFFKQSFAIYVSLLPLGIVIAELFKKNSLDILFLIPTFLFLYFSLKRQRALKEQTETVLEKLVDILENKSLETAQHSKRVHGWVEDMCNELNMEESKQAVLLQAAALHDLGKVGITDELLTKPEKLSEEEFHHIQAHPTFSAQILEGLVLFDGGREIVLHHHERYDGKGYPDHLAGENIPFGSRVIAVADSFDAMISARSYRTGSRTVLEALQVLEDCSGTQFDPALVIIFKKIILEHIKTKNMKNLPPNVEIGSKIESSPSPSFTSCPGPLPITSSRQGVIPSRLPSSGGK